MLMDFANLAKVRQVASVRDELSHRRRNGLLSRKHACNLSLHITTAIC